MLLFLQPMFFTLLITLFISAAFLFKWLSSATQTPPKNLPPSPRKLPIIGNLHQLGLAPHRSLHNLAQKHGPLMLLHLGSVPTLVVSSADAAREIMKTNDLIFASRPKMSIPSRLLYDGKDIAFAPYGDYWRQVRSISVLHLLSNKKVQSLRNEREEETVLMIEKIRQQSTSSSSSPSLVNLSEMFMTLTNGEVCRVALGRKYSGGESGRKYKEVLGQFVELLGASAIGDYIPWLAWVDRISGLDARVEKVAKAFDQFLEGVIQEHMDQKKVEISCGEIDQAKEGHSFVDILLDIQIESLVGFPIGRDTIKAIIMVRKKSIMDMFAAGTDTVYTSIEWVMTELLRHPKVMKKLQKEVRHIAGGKSTVSEDDLEKMYYLKAVVKEALRLHAPIPLLVPRESTEDAKLMGYDISAGTRVLVNAWAIGRDPSSWEEPEKFRPERFLDSSIDFKGVHFELIPFGAGRRGCPGIHFAIASNELALANVLHNFNIALPGGEKGEDLDTAETSGIAVHKKTPLIIVATPHSY